MSGFGYTPADPATGEPARFNGCIPLPGNVELVDDMSDIALKDRMHGFLFDDEDGAPQAA
ncbi:MULTISPECIES: hypothetical protein [Streptomyces]|uniref:Uncharacterized protein n=1 Tax=Streptomyces evansiae TaxID=3075535 RepID=A0ABU2RCL4_9ACTN|nr:MULTISPECIES: hypothetical protein [unclassified Streptomyces]MDT0413480.1 hypothetical protein [Streptomyces sp. DSM 41979]MYQ61768.1 hypothetical protein [Streptomyces sp. SID4926]SCE31745.1 hypothetical protein GA0115252_14111 [Streptomyces sp. DfronAA-171]